MKSLFLTILIACTATVSQAQTDILPLARKVNNYFMAQNPDPAKPTFVKKRRPSNLWTRAVYYEGLAALYSIDPDSRYTGYTDTWGNAHKWLPRNGVGTTDADDQCCGQTYLWRYEATADTSRLNGIISNLDHQMSTGRYDYWTWIDAIQMAMPVYAMAYRATGQRRYADYAMAMYRCSRDTLAGGLFDKTAGLWWRDKNFKPPYREPDGKACYWSRGNGWVYAALVRTLGSLGPDDQYSKALAADYTAMTEALVGLQRKDGFWNASLVSTSYAGPEVTGTALFLYGLSWGLNNGLLPHKRKYTKACRRAWQALKSSVHADGFIGYAQGTGDDPSDGQPVTFDSHPDFEDYGTGCWLLGATEYYKLVKGEE